MHGLLLRFVIQVSFQLFYWHIEGKSAPFEQEPDKQTFPTIPHYTLSPFLGLPIQSIFISGSSTCISCIKNRNRICANCMLHAFLPYTKMQFRVTQNIVMQFRVSECFQHQFQGLFLGALFSLITQEPLLMSFK